MRASAVLRRKKAPAAVFAADIAGFVLSFKSDSPGIISILRRRYGLFGVKKSGGCLFDVHEEEGRALPFRPAVSFDWDQLGIRRGDFRAALDLRTGRGELAAAPNAQCLDAFLRSLISTLLLRSGGLMVHSAGLVKGGRAYIFPGKSGAGKTTLSKLAASAGAEVISDEINLLRRERGGWRVYGSPFWGEMRADGRPGSWPLGGVYIVKKACAGRVAPCGRADVLKTLMRCIVNFERTARASAAALGNAAGLLAGTRAAVMEFSKNDAAFMGLI